MRKIKGKDLLVFMDGGNGYKSVALSTSCSLDVNVATISVMSADSWWWQNFKPGKKTWTVGCTAQLFDQVDPMDLLDKKVRLMFGTAGDNFVSLAPGTRTPDGYIRRYGEAFVTSIQESGEVGGAATYSMTFVGNGELHHDKQTVHGATWYNYEDWKDLEIWKDE